MLKELLILWLLLLPIKPVLAQIAVDATVSSDQRTALSTVATRTFSTSSANELLLAFVSADNVSGTNTTVTGISGTGLTWALVVRTNVQRGTAEIWRAFAPSVLNNIVVTATLSQKVCSSMTVMSFTGVNTSGTNGSGAVGATGTGNGNPGAPTATLTTTSNSSWVVGVGSDWDNAIARTLGANQSLIHQYLAPVGDTYWVQMKNSVTPLSGTSVTINDTGPTGDQYNLSICEIIPAGGGASSFTLSGTVSPASSGSGTLLTLSGASSATATADSSGNYSFAGLANGTYTVTPSKAGFTFSPASQSVTLNGANVTAINFTAATQTWSISGTVSPASSGSGTLLTLSGPSSATATADSSGNYSFAGLANGVYTVTPSKAGFTFSPASQSVTINGANATAVNFTAQLTAGAIRIDAQAFGDGATASTTVKASAFSTTAANELLLAFVATDYRTGTNTTVTGVSGGGLVWVLVVRTNAQSGTSEIWRAFAPSLLSKVTVAATLSQAVVSSITVLSFTGIDPSGTNGSGAIGATKSASAKSGAPTASLVTTRNSAWVFGVGDDYDNAIARTPGSGQSLVHQDLASTGDTYWVQMQNIPTPLNGTNVTINDTAPTSDRYNLSICEVLPAPAAQTFSISGTLSPSSAGSGATVVLSGTSSNTVTADSSGNYSFAGLANGTYTVTPSNSGYSFSPPSQTLTINDANVANVNFTGTALSGQTFSISGTISPSAGGSGAAVTLNGKASATTTASSSGSYSFSGLANGTYAVTPSNAGFTFSPATQTVTLNGNSVTGVNFVASPAFAISGAISPAPSGTGATVTLSGAANATTTASSSGTYSFSGLANGAYTVTPSNTGFTFSPTAQAVTLNGNNVTGVDFTGTAIAQNGCGQTLNSSSPTCQVIGSGTLNPTWTVISRHGEYSQDENECNIPDAISTSSGPQDSGGLTITTNNNAYTCGDFNDDGTVKTSPASWPYRTGDLQWTSLSFTYGTVTIRGKIPAAASAVWPAYWFLDTRCQNQNIYNGSASACSDSSYAEIDMAEFISNGSYTGTWPSISVFNGTSPSTCRSAQTPIDTNFHTYVMTRSAGALSETIDGVSTGCSFSGNSVTNSPVFAIIQVQTATGALGPGPPNNAVLPVTMVTDFMQVKDSAGALIFADNFRTDIYFAQASAGMGSGDDCADARSIGSMLAMDWNPGNTLHLCGTYTTQPVALGSGTSGSPIVVTYESGACGPCPSLNGQSYITVVGGGCSYSSAVAPSPTMQRSDGEDLAMEALPLATGLTNK